MSGVGGLLAACFGRTLICATQQKFNLVLISATGTVHDLAAHTHINYLYLIVFVLPIGQSLRSRDADNMVIFADKISDFT